MVFEKVAKILADYKGLDVATIAPETTFAQLELDSLDKVELIMGFEESFEVQIDMTNPIECVQDLVTLIEGQVPGGAL